MKVMIVGSGGREHAIAAKVARSPLVTELLCAPGNGGTGAIARNVAVNAEDVAAVVALAKAERVDFVIVGPEGPLVLGLVDALADAGILAFGPRREAARMEGSKVWSKRFMHAHGIPTAASEAFSDVDAAERFVKQSGKAWVVKADGLAAGKGVIVAADVAETLDGIDRIMRKREFGDAGAEVVLEERLFGQEVSYHVILDGDRFVPLAAAQDHKRLEDGDLGPNTGGMGAYSPPPVVTPDVERKIIERVIAPTVQGFRKDGIDFRGALFVGLMIDGGEPRVLEYNVRFGDPETEVLMARYGGDVLPLFLGSARGDLREVTPRWETPVALCVVLAAPGYPSSVKKNLPISGLASAAEVTGVQVLHAGTRSEGSGVVTSGGRVLCVTASGSDIDEVAARAYQAVDLLHFEGMQLRRDIGHHAREIVTRRTTYEITELAALVELLRAGGVVACPTETFIGLLADATNPYAVDRVCELKGREATSPLGVLVPSLEMLETLVQKVPAHARELAERHWPGPLTLVLPMRSVSPALPAQLHKDGKLGARVPGPSPALELVRAFGGALTATSANKTGEPALRTSAEVLQAFGGELSAIVTGESPGGLPSTVIDATSDALVVIRAGAVAVTERRE